MLHTSSPPVGTDPVNRSSLLAEIAEHSQIIPVADATARAQLLTDLDAKGIVPSATAPLYVDQLDVATIYRNVGAGWQYVASLPAPRIEKGNASLVYGTGTAPLTAFSTITFSPSFATAPEIAVTPEGNWINMRPDLYITGRGVDGFTLNGRSTVTLASQTTLTVSWIAIGTY